MNISASRRMSNLVDADISASYEWLKLEIIELIPVERDQILEKLRERIVRFAASRLSRDNATDSAAGAQDIAQEVLIVLHEKYSSVDRIEELVPLSMEIARLKIWGARRKSVRHGEKSQLQVEDLPLASREESPLQQVERREQLERLEVALAGLGDRCRELFRLKLEGLTFPEIQKRLKVESINTLYTWDFRCRKTLLERMGGSLERKEKSS
ncbi:MAG: sigma-70 family RNA polymerase sigma factor [Acidobacteriota bacterium]